ncbi:MAG: RluA family pseudouridine synthase [Clostridia bacterium]|nr:RluA family pseudouridine synthase [Clostridia bacterium]
MALYEAIVPREAAGQRVDVFIKKNLPEIPSVVVMAAFRRRDVKVDGTRVKQDMRLTPGSRVQVYCMEQQSPALDIVYEDEDILLINKPAGINVEPDEKGGVTLTDLAKKHIAGKADFAHACHRLDNKTCGLVLFAKNPRAEEILHRAFKNRTLDKRYQCLVRGMMKPPAATCRAYLKKDAKAAVVTVYDREVPGARPIITEYEAIENGPVSRLRIHLVTGRTHQIRAHMAALGHPLLGDDIYGDRAFNRANHVRRLMLCACELTLETGGELPRLDGRHFAIKCPF